MSAEQFTERIEQPLARLLMETSADGLAVLDENERLLMLNERFAALWQREAAQLAGRTFETLCAEAHASAHEETHAENHAESDGALIWHSGLLQIAEALRQRRPLVWQTGAPAGGAAPSWLAISVMPLPAPNQTLLLLRVHAEGEDDAGVAAARDQSRWLSRIAHEARAPLNRINGFLDLLLDAGASAEEELTRSYLQRARAGSEDLYLLLENLLCLMRAERGLLSLTPEPLQLRQIAAAAAEELEYSARLRQIEITIEAAHRLPPVRADNLRLRQILRNLLSNALRATATGGQVTLRARAVAPSPRAKKGALVISIEDQGAGIAPAQLPHVFARFYRAPSSGESQGGAGRGLGLGLNVARLLTRLHGGAIGLGSAVGQGTTALLLLPGWDEQST